LFVDFLVNFGKLSVHVLLEAGEDFFEAVGNGHGGIGGHNAWGVWLLSIG